MNTKRFVFFLVLAIAFIYNVNAQKTRDDVTPGFFATKYTKEKVWDAQRSPSYPAAGKDWKLSGFKPVKGGDGKVLDWGKDNDRYVMFFTETDTKKLATSITDDVNNSGNKLTVVLKLFESNGTLVKVVSTKGKIIGIGDKGFMYEIEGRYGAFFPVGSLNAKDIIIYRPTTLLVKKLSELNNKK